MNRHLICTSLVFAASLAACGGGGGGSGTPPPSSPTDAQRLVAATATAQSSSNGCAAIQPFYWELGDRDARLASGSVNSASDPTVYTAATQMSIASSTKWLYASYIAQKRAAVLTAADIKFLTFRSGYTSFSTCLPGQTVDGCLNTLNNGAHSDATDGSFFYSGGHMQKHASVEGLGAMGSAALATELRAQLGTDIGLAFSQPQPAGGGISSADDYARFLRKLLAQQLAMNGLLGSNAVCANPLTCPAGVAESTPVPTNETWHYSIGHWVEDDPVVGDGAFSSAGAFGFYPWIDASKHWYGVIARRVDAGSGIDSVVCGRAIRKAWITGVAP
ncbi:MAG: hypothetical protein ABI702_14145 [Burkholderiales bacterium]